MKHKLQTLLKHKLQWLLLLTVLLSVCIEAEAFVIRFYSESSWSSVNAWVWPSDGVGSNKNFTKIGNNWWHFNETDISGDYYVIFRQSDNWDGDNPRSKDDGDKLSGSVQRKCSTGSAHTNVSDVNYFYIKRQKSSTSSDWGWVELTKSGSTWSSDACAWYGIGSVLLQYNTETPTDDAKNADFSDISNKDKITSGSDVVFKINDETLEISVEYATADVKYAVGNVAGGNVKVNYTNATGTSTTSSATTSTSLQTVKAAYSKNVTYIATNSSGYRFVGWYSTNSTSGTKLSSEASWTTSTTSSGKSAYAIFELDCTHLDDEDYSIYITGTDPHSTTTTYDGSAKSVTLTAVTTGAPTNGTISYTGTGSTSYSKNTDAPSGAGTYAITYTVGASGGFCAETDLGLGSITISQASQSAPTVNGISPSVGPGDYRLSATGGTAGYYYYEIVSEGTTGTASIVNNGTETVTLSVTKIGDLYVKAKRLGNSNYAESAFGDATKLTFTKADQATAVVVTDITGPNLCGIGLKNLAATGGDGTGYYSYEIVDGGTGSATITDNETASAKLNVTAVGSIKIRAKRLDDDNHNVSSYGDTKTFTFKNSGSLSDFVVTGAEKKYYTGSPISVSVTSDVYSSITVKYNGSTTAPTNPGSYPVTITTAATDTYCAVTNLAAGTLVIKVFIRMIDNKREEWKWNDVKMHYWGGTCSGSSCPGSAMTSEGSNVWTMELDCVPAGLLFDNGTCSGSNMTVDATYTVGKCYEVVDDKTSEKHNVNLIECSCSDPTISASPSGSSWTKCANVSEAQRQISVTASGGTGTLTYQWYRNSVASTSGAVAVTDMVEGGNTYAPSASDEGTFYYYCVVRSGGYCSANSATSGFSGALTILDTPVIQPAAPDVKQYEPVKLTSTNSRVTWSVSPVASETGYLYEQTQKSVTFKGQTGSYTVTATPASGSGCTSTSSITVSNDDSEGC